VSNIRYRHRSLRVACELDAAEVGNRVGEWRHLREQAGLGSEPVPGGARLWLRPEAADVAGDLARREAACCGFLDLELAVDGDQLRLDVTSPATDAGPAIAWLIGGEPCLQQCC
jgi:hypothetical protein